MSLVRVAAAGDLAPGSMRRCVVEGTPICLVHKADGTYRAVQDACTHEQASLAEGWHSDNEVECPLHSSIFDLDTGEPLSMPATEPLAVFAVELKGDDVFVRLDGKED